MCAITATMFAAVVAETEVAAAQAARAVKVEYEELPFVLDPQEAMKDGAPFDP